MQVLWLRYLTENNDQTLEIPAELMENPEIKKAVSVLEESAFTDAQLLGYEKFWDIISVEKTLYGSGWRRGLREGREAGKEEGIREGIEEGRKEGIKEGMKAGKAKGETEMRCKIACNLKKTGLPLDVIIQTTGLTAKEIDEL